MDLAYGLFMADTENAFPDKRKKSIDGAIEDFKALKSLGINPNACIKQVLDSHNLKECQLSKSEIRHINDAVNRS